MKMRESCKFRIPRAVFVELLRVGQCFLPEQLKQSDAVIMQGLRTPREVLAVKHSECDSPCLSATVEARLIYKAYKSLKSWHTGRNH